MDIIKKMKIYGVRQSLNFIFSELYLQLWMQRIKKSYSQSGEDLVLYRMLKKKKRGMYVDIGAYDPTRYSNTKKFYDLGWKGVNIEPDKKNFEKFVALRKNDINLNIGIGKKTGKMIFFKFIPDTLSTFSENEAKKYQKQGYTLISKYTVVINNLKNVLRTYVGKKKIDFISVDTEGLDLEVLESNDWKKYRPKFICIENTIHNKDVSARKKNRKLEVFLEKIAYKKIFDNGLNAIFQDIKFRL